MSGGRSRRRDDDGAAAVESALVLSVVLAPLLMGILTYGYYFWQAQKVPLLDPNIDQAGIVGELCEGELLTRVRAAALTAVTAVDDTGALPVTLGDITATVVSVVPDGLGVNVTVSVTTSIGEGSFLPLPNDGNVTKDVLMRLQNVTITTSGCG
jgi:hypothetical protein